MAPITGSVGIHSNWSVIPDCSCRARNIVSLHVSDDSHGGNEDIIAFANPRVFMKATYAYIYIYIDREMLPTHVPTVPCVQVSNALQSSCQRVSYMHGCPCTGVFVCLFLCVCVWVGV